MWSRDLEAANAKLGAITVQRRLTWFCPSWGARSSLFRDQPPVRSTPVGVVRSAASPQRGAVNGARPPGGGTGETEPSGGRSPVANSTDVTGPCPDNPVKPRPCAYGTHAVALEIRGNVGTDLLRSRDIGVSSRPVPLQPFCDAAAIQRECIFGIGPQRRIKIGKCIGQQQGTGPTTTAAAHLHSRQLERGAGPTTYPWVITASLICGSIKTLGRETA